MLAIGYFAKDLPRWERNKKEKKWDRYIVNDIRGSTLGIIGGYFVSNSATAACLHLSIYPSIHPSIAMAISMYRNVLILWACLSISSYIYLFIYPPTHLPVNPSVPFINNSIHIQLSIPTSQPQT